MHHYRGTLLEGATVRLDPANVYVEFGMQGADGSSDWSGYLVTKSDGDVTLGTTYTLRLEDGRAGELRVESITPDDAERFRATFVGLGSMA